jgi:hypothetical protein
MTPIQIAALRFVCDRPIDRAGRHKTVDLREISEPMRQRLIDLAMHEPPLVDVDADQVRPTWDGYCMYRAAGNT